MNTPLNSLDSEETAEDEDWVKSETAENKPIEFDLVNFRLLEICSIAVRQNAIIITSSKRGWCSTYFNI